MIHVHPRGRSRVLPTVLLALFAPALVFAQDTTPPAFVTMSFSPDAIDVTAGPFTVTVSGRLTDDLSGVNYGCIRFMSPSQQASRYGCMYAPGDRISGDDLDGTYTNSTTATFQQYIEAGTWHVDQAYVFDKIGNYRYYTEAELIALGVATTLEVTSTQDIAAPEIQSVSFSPATITVSNGAETITVGARLTDNVAGVHYGCIRFRSPSQQFERYGCMYAPGDRISGDDLDGVYSNNSSATFQQYIEAGTWHADQAYVFDKIGNYRYYTEADLIALGAATTLEVISNPSDTQPPSLLSPSFTPSVINTSLGPRTVTVTARLIDNLSGVSYGCLRFRSPSHQAERYGCMYSPADRTSGDDYDGLYSNSSSATFEQFGELGTWRLDQAYVFDRIGNYRYYNEAELVALGLSTTLRVTNSQYPTAVAGPDQTLQTAGTSAPATLDGSASSDPDVGDVLTYEWRDAANNVVGTTAIININVPVGSHIYTLTVDDGNGSTASDTVLITVADLSAPTVAVVRPNGGEKLYSGTPYVIEWTASDNGVLSFFDVFYSVDGGTNYTPVPNCSAVPGTLRSCAWTSPGPTTSQLRIRVTATDGSSNTASDASNANASILAGTGSITITGPKSFADWGIGSTQELKWSHTLGSSAYVRIEVSRDGRETWEVIQSSFKNTGNASSTFNWVVTGPGPSASVRFRVTWLNGPSVSDISNVDTAISRPYVALAAPTLPADHGYGTARTQTWSSNLGSTDKVQVLLSADDGETFPHTLANNVSATKKKANYTTPTLGSPTTVGRIRVVWQGNPTVHSTTPMNLSVGPASVKVTEPNVASDVWTVGSTATIRWTSNLEPSEQVRIELSLDGGGTYPIVITPGTPSDGSHAVSVLAGWATSNARVKITRVANSTVVDVSAENFVIQ